MNCSYPPEFAGEDAIEWDDHAGSILYVAIWHALFDMFAASKMAQDIIPIAMSAMVIVIVLLVTRANRPWNFHRLEKSVL